MSESSPSAPSRAAEPKTPATAPPADVPAARIDLLAGFSHGSRSDWERSAADVVNKPRSQGKQLAVEEAVQTLRTRTLDDYWVEPFYDPDSAPPMPAESPGEFPFTRGAALRPAELPWDVRQQFDDPDVERTAAAISTDLEHGVSSVFLVVGSDGLAPQHLPAAVASVLTDLAPIALGCATSRSESITAALALRDVLRDRPVPG